jgi:hypothetical protein
MVNQFVARSNKNVDIYGHLIPGSTRQMVNRPETPPAATYPQPAKIKKA